MEDISGKLEELKQQRSTADEKAESDFPGTRKRE